ncbi:MAG: transglycosylase SLT domain-containing protein [Tranquillimonas sp.]
MRATMRLGQRAALAAMLAIPIVPQDAPGRPAPDPATLCAEAAVQAARETGVPERVLRAIARTETGRNRGGRVTPWPWTVNLEGEGHWFDSRDEALTFAYRAFKAGRRSFDAGCFQINYRWHGRNFASIDEMFDPLAGARYAAGFLARLHAELGDWSRAAGAYHSRTEALARRYRRRFDDHLAALASAPAPVVPAPPAAAAEAGSPPAAANRFPLLGGAGGPPRGAGSLVPLSGAALPLIGG